MCRSTSCLGGRGVTAVHFFVSTTSLLEPGPAFSVSNLKLNRGEYQGKKRGQDEGKKLRHIIFPHSRKRRLASSNMILHPYVMKRCSLALLCVLVWNASAFQTDWARTRQRGVSKLHALNKRNKFNKQKDLAAKMEAARRARELADGKGSDDNAVAESPDTSIEVQNDRRRFEDMLESSMAGGSYDDGYYLTEEQENEAAAAAFSGVLRLYEGDPAPTDCWKDLLNLDGDAIGKGGMKRTIPWMKSGPSSDYLVVITDPRPKSVELRTAMKRISTLGVELRNRIVVINSDTPAENRRFVKRNFGGEGGSTAPRILSDEKLDLMREYTALGEKRFSMTMFVLRNGKVERLVREVEAEVLKKVVVNACKSLI